MKPSKRCTINAASNGTASYHWYKNGVPIGANSPVLSLTDLDVADDGAQITVEVTDSCARTTSTPATLTVFADASQCLGGNSGQEAPNSLDRDLGGAYPHSGEFYLLSTDLTIPGRGFDFSWRRKYRSREMRDSAQGVQWDFSYNRRVEIDPADPANRLVHDGNSRIDGYTPNGSGCWTSPGLFRELCEVEAGGRYELTFAAKHKWVFAALDGASAEGKIVDASDRNGNSMSFAYDAVGKLTTITDTLGRPITVGYNAQNLISSITDYAGRNVTYDYYMAGEPADQGDEGSVFDPVSFSLEPDRRLRRDMRFRSARQMRSSNRPENTSCVMVLLLFAKLRQTASI